MVRAKDFDKEEYQAALENFGRCRRGIKSYEVWELLVDVQPGDLISGRTIMLLEKWISTNPSASYGNCYQAAAEIKRILLGE